MVVLCRFVEWSGLFIIKHINSGIVFNKKTYNPDITIDSRKVEGMHVYVVRCVHIRSWKCWMHRNLVQY